MAKIKVRTRYFFAVEGEGERSFIKLIESFCNKKNLFVHLDTEVLNGGGYQPMLIQAAFLKKKRNVIKNTEKAAILLIDQDRAERQDDKWTLDKLKHEAQKQGFIVCAQIPNQEGLFFRMFTGNENKMPNTQTITKDIRKIWPQYKKPIDFQDLSKKFTLDDLLRVAISDSEIGLLLKTVGLF